MFDTKLFTSFFNNDSSLNIIHNEPIAINNFKLPITYLNDDCVFKIHSSVSDDLELFNNTDSCIYNTILSPKNKFAQFNVKYWNEHYTNNIEFLTDTQSIIKKFNIFNTKSSNDCDIINDIWNETKNNASFYHKYNYLDWDILKHFNTYSPILLLFTLLQLSTPFLFFLAPIFIMIVPFFILKYQGLNISYDMYFKILKQVFKQQIYGKFMNGLSGNYSNNIGILYMLACFAFYIMQIYNNFKTCSVFYNNIKQVNNYITKLDGFLNNSIHNMNSFLSLSSTCNSYKPFNIEIENHKNNIANIRLHISKVSEFALTPSKVLEFGELLKIFYIIHSNVTFEKTFQFCIGFEGYIDNIHNIHNLYSTNHLAFAKFGDSYNCKINNQIYPPLYSSDNSIKNSVDLSSNAIITGPNASGKTTAIKSTLINIILTQQFGLGFYESCYINPYTHLHSYINIPDTSNRDSLFQAESRRCKDIIDIILANSNPNKYRHFCIFDELYSGTNPIEAPKAGYAFLKYLNKFKHVNLILTTHYFFICKKFKKSNKITNYQMQVLLHDKQNHEFTYKMIPGVSELKGAIKILKDMDYPDEIIKTFENI